MMDGDAEPPAKNYAKAAKSTPTSFKSSVPSSKTSLGIFNRRSNVSSKEVVLVCDYGKLNCSVNEFLIALKSVDLLSSAWGVTKHFQNRQFEFALHNNSAVTRFLQAEINFKGHILQFRRKYIPKVHVLVQNIPIGFLRSGFSSYISILGKHLASERGHLDTWYCQKTTVEGEQILQATLFL